MADGKVVIDTGLNTAGIEKDLNKLGSIAKKGLGVTAKAVAAVSTALVGAGGYAAKVGSDFEAAMSKVSAISGAAGEDLDALTEKAKEMGAKTKFSATESAQAFEYMAMAGWKTGDMLNGIDGIMNLAAASGEDLASVSDIVTDALTAFGLQAKDSAHFADVLARASSSSNTNVGMMGATFKYVAPIAGSMKYSIEDTATAIGLMANAGIKGEQAGTALRAMLTRLVKPPKDAAAAMKALGLSAENADGTMKPLRQVLKDMRKGFADLDDSQKAQYAASIAGQEAMSGLLAIVNASDEDFEKLSSAIDNADGAALTMAETMQNNLKGQITILGSSLEGLGIEIYEGMEEPLKGAAEAGIEYVNRLTEVFKSDGLTGIVQETGEIFAELATKAAQNAPKMVHAAVSLLQSFVAGIAKNRSQLLKAAQDIVLTLVNGLVSLLPKQIRKPVEEAIKGMVSAFKNGGLDKAVKTLATVFTNLAKIVGNVAKTVLPPLSKAIDFCAGHLDTLLPLLTGAVVAFKGFTIIQKTSGMLTTAASAFKAASIAAEAYSLQQQAAAITGRAYNVELTVSQAAVGLLTGKVTLATAAQAAWNAIMSANPIGIVVTAVAALAAGLGVLALATREEAQETDEQIIKSQQLVEEAEKLNSTVDDQVNSWKELKNSKEEGLAADIAQIDNTESLWEQLQNITDENGKVKKGYEDRAAFITTTLSDALGIEIKMTNGTIEKYKELKGKVGELIQAKRTEAVMEAMNAEYKEAIAKRMEAANKQADLYNKKIELENQLKKNGLELDQLKIDLQEAILSGDSYEEDRINKRIAKYEEESKKVSEKLEETNKSYQKQAALVADYSNTIQLNEELAAAAATGNTEKINAAIVKLTSGLKTATNANQSELEQQVENMEQHERYIRQAVENGTPGFEKSMVDQAHQATEAAKVELNTAKKKYKTSGQSGGYQYTVGVGGGIDSGKDNINKKGKEAINEAGKGGENADPYGLGNSLGADFASGFAAGIENSAAKRAIEAGGAKIVAAAKNSTKKAQDSNSPSKLAAKLGRDYGNGYAMGIEKQAKTVAKSAKSLVKQAANTMKAAVKNGNFEAAGEKASKNFESGMNKAVSSAEKSVKNLVNKYTAEIKKKSPKAAKEYEKYGKSLIDAFSKSFESQAKAATTKVTNALTKLAESTQEKYDEIINKRDSLRDKLSDFGDLYTKSSKGNVKLGDLKKNTEQINQYAKNLDKLKKKGVSKDLMSEIVSLNAEDGAAFASKLASLSDKELKAYNAAFVEQQKAAKKISDQYYAGEISSLKKNFTSQVNKQLSGLTKQLNNIGKDAAAGFAKGINSKNISKDLKKFSDSIVKKIKKDLKIKSPSRRLEDEVGAMLPPGVAQGIEKNGKVLNQALENMSDDAVNAVDGLGKKLSESALDGFDVSGAVGKMQAAVLAENVRLGAQISTTVNYKVSGSIQDANEQKSKDLRDIGVVFANELVGMSVEVDKRPFGRIMREVLE